jgi:hypothetical protein
VSEVRGRAMLCLSYLFLLVADVLQAMIQEDGFIRHPIADAACPVLQASNMQTIH